ncbi:uncharacterized protein [Musca autumnalis]|uniref:uncharacterized protein n=1 Tax=Musca autumnalis TaxID=221902 RepID=UPI003CF30EF7
MISSVESFFDDEENVQDIASIRRNLRDKSNPLELPSALFKAYFRLPKDAVVYVVETLKDDFKTLRQLRFATSVESCHTWINFDNWQRHSTIIVIDDRPFSLNIYVV